jgi:large subunit ribosomal protein L25
MSSTHTYATQARSGLGSSAAVKLRAGGQVPVTINRAGKPSQHVALDEKLANHLAAHVHHLCKVEIDGKQLTALRGEIAKDCMTDRIKHIDLQEVDENSEIKVDVAVVPDSRNCPGVKAGGIVELRARTVTVRCRANAIPDQLPVDLSEVQLQGSITVAKITLPKGVTLITSNKTLLLSVVIPRGMKAAADEAAAAAAAPVEGEAVPAAVGPDGKPLAAAAPAAAGAKPAAAGKAPAGEAKDAAPKKK